VPRFTCSVPRLEVAWANAWYRLRRRLLVLGEQGYTLPIFREEGASHVELESLSYVLLTARWLKDVEYVQGPVRAFLFRQREDWMLPWRLPPATEWSRQTGLARFVLDAFEVNGSESFLRENLPLLRDGIVTLLEGGEENCPGYLDPGFELFHVVRGLRLLGDEPEAVALEERWSPSIEQGAAMELRWDQEFLDGGAVISAWIRRSGFEEHPSILADQMIRVVGGLEPRDDGRIELRPRLHALEHFVFEGLHYRGHVLDLYWDRPDGVVIHEGIPEGYTLREGDEVLFHAEALTDILLD